MEPLNKKSQIAQEYGLLPADARQQQASYWKIKHPSSSMRRQLALPPDWESHLK